MGTVIIDYGSGNLRSAAKAFERAAREVGYTGSIAVSSAPEWVAAADRIVLPGVGAFGDCRAGLDAVDGMVEAVTEAVRDRGRPFLGICVGMQLMATVGREHGDHPGLDWVPGEVVPITPAPRPDGRPHKVPHMGWNALAVSDAGRAHPVLAGVADGDHAYFVHGFHLRAVDAGHVLATADYGGPLTAVVARDTMVGTQFHPEKSQAVGLRLIGSFLGWTP